jgi:hypothetical protein
MRAGEILEGRVVFCRAVWRVTGEGEVVLFTRDEFHDVFETAWLKSTTWGSHTNCNLDCTTLNMRSRCAMCKPNGAVTLLTSRYVSYVSFVIELFFTDNNILRTR